MKKSKPKQTSAAPKRNYTSQLDIPKRSLEDCITLAKALFEEFNGETAPHELAKALSISPTSSAWQAFSGAAVAYGLTDAGYAASVIKLTELGRNLLTHENEGDDIRAIQEAALRPRIMRDFFTKYNRGKFPQENIGINVLNSMGVPREKAAEVYSMVRSAGLLAGFITETKTGFYVSLQPTGRILTPSSSLGDADLTNEKTEIADKIQNPPPQSKAEPVIASAKNNKVFITHGKNRSIVEQLKEILKFGKFDPVVAVEHETPSRPVPEKVLSDMRACFASVIHVESEEVLLTADGNKIQRINENVLIEIGASMALYGNNFVLLFKKGIHPPSNLQGLYRCEYEGDKLDYEATMKLLKAFNEFR